MLRSKVLALASVAAFTLTCLEQRAHAGCANGLHNRRQIVGQIPDLVFVSGVPATRYINPVYFNWDSIDPNDATFTFADCGAIARSNLAHVSVQAKYGETTVHPPFTWAPIDHAASESAPPEYLYSYPYTGTPGYLVPIIFDGAPACTTVGDDVGNEHLVCEQLPIRGTIDIAVRGGEFNEPNIVIGHVNVYIVAGTTSTDGFVSAGTSAPITADSVTLDNPLLNDNPNARLFVTHYSILSGANNLPPLSKTILSEGRWNHPIAASYDSSSHRWRIRNEDGYPMQPGLIFYYRINPSAVRVATSAAAQNYIELDDPDSRADPYASIVVSPWSGGASRISHPYAVKFYNYKWRIYLTDGANMPSGGQAGFFVSIIGASQYLDADYPGPSSIRSTDRSIGSMIDIRGPASSVLGNARFLQSTCWNKLARPVIVTLNTSVLPGIQTYTGPIDARFFGEASIGGQTVITHEDGSLMDRSLAFNVWGYPDSTCLDTGIAVRGP